MPSAGRPRLLYLLPNAFYVGAHWADRIRAAAALFSVTVATPADRDVALPDLGGAEVVDLPLRRGRPSPWREWSTFRAVRRLIREAKPDILHAATVRPVIYGGIAARLAGTPAAVFSITGLGYLFGDSFGARVARPATRLAYKIALGGDNRVATFENPADRVEFVAAGLVTEAASRVFLGVGLDLDAFPYVPEASGDGPPLVVLPSRLLAEKGIAAFAAAARLLRERGVRARFVLAGDVDPGNPTSLTREQIAAWVAAGTLEWWGFRSDIAEVLRQAAIVCLPSHYREGAPRVLMEAAATGRAAVTTDMPGCRDVVVAGETGLLVPPRNPAALAGALQRLLAEPTERARMGAAGRRRAEAEFSSGLAVARMMAVYRDLAAQLPAAGAR